MSNLFQHVKDAVKVSDYVRTLPQMKGLHPVGTDKWRCNNVISEGDSPDAMYIDDSIGMFKMFSHGQESGDIINLHNILMSNNTMSNREAAISLAQTMGVALEPSMLNSGGGTSRKSLTDAMDALCDRLHDYLMNSESEDAVKGREYLSNRGMSDELIRKWRLGMFPSDTDSARQMVLECGKAYLFQKTGILKGRDNDYVVMAGRLASPIFSRYGKCVSFSSRVIPGVECQLQDNKYINTSSTDIYNKSETLYGQHLIERDTRRLVICEGNYDVIALNEMVPEGTVAVATCGTSLTENHVNGMKKMRLQSVIFMFDSDEAGKKAVSSAVWVVNFLSNVGVKSIPSGKDPWEAFVNGDEINFDVKVEPMVEASSRLVFESTDRQDYLDWVKGAYDRLVFSDDRFELLSSASRLTGMRKRQLEYRISGDEKNPYQSDGYSSSNNSDLISPAAILSIRTLLAMDRNERRLLLFPLFYRSKQVSFMDLLGVVNETDKYAVRVAMGVADSSEDIDVSSMVFSVAPTEEQYDSIFRDFSQHVAVSLTTEMYRYGVPSWASPYLGAVSSVSSGFSAASGVDQITFIVDFASSIV